MSAPRRIAQTLDLLAVEIPDSLWEELLALTPPRELWLD
jgi:D-threo-aldose 1-dehydrogenase